MAYLNLKLPPAGHIGLVSSPDGRHRRRIRRRRPPLDGGGRARRPSERGKLALTGPQAKELLSGQVTNDVAALAPGTGWYAALLTNKGSMLGDLRVLATGDGLWLTERAGLPALFDPLRRGAVGWHARAAQAHAAAGAVLVRRARAPGGRRLPARPRARQPGGPTVGPGVLSSHRPRPRRPPLRRARRRVRGALDVPVCPRRPPTSCASTRPPALRRSTWTTRRCPRRGASTIAP